LLSFAKENRPLVLNFGSNSWPPFVEKLREFGEIQNDFADIADFLIVYIEEAHPVDGWKLNVSPFCFITFLNNYTPRFLWVAFWQTDRQTAWGTNAFSLVLFMFLYLVYQC
jgi:hypothetical protein